MKNLILTTAGLAMVFLVGLNTTARPQAAGAQQYDRATQYGGALDARQHGYEHAYRDGADRGRQDRDARRAYSLRQNDYMSGQRTYEPAFGDRAQYMQGYRDGYKDGYEDGFNGRPGKYSQLYARPNTFNRAPERDPYADRSHSWTDMAFDTGYRDGITSGQQDQSHNMRSDFRSNDTYRGADLGYRANYGDREAYRLQFRDGFERGYEDGYGRRSGGNDRSGNDRGGNDRGGNDRGGNDRGGNRPNNGDTRNNQNNRDTRDQQNTRNAAPGGTFTVAANRQWTPTGIRVNQGDVLQISATGEIHFTGNNVASPAGSLEHKTVPGSPLPAVFAGALIGRIDSGQPFGIGDQKSLTMPASGLLYLGVNDDIVTDNTGQFQVVISGR